MFAATIVDNRLEWREHPDPTPGPHDLVVGVRAAGINGGDVLQVAGFYPAPPWVPADIPGLETAGEVVATGSAVQGFSVGDRVMAVTGGGGHAELATFDERLAIPVPDTVSWAEAGGFAEAYMTAHDALIDQAGLSVGERVCVHGAAGGVGVAAVQLAVAAGATVVASVRSEERRPAVAALGAIAVAPEDVADAGPFDVIVELVGAPNMETNIAMLAKKGRICVIGVGAGAKASVNLLALMNCRGRIYGSTLRSRSAEDRATAAQAVVRHVVPLLAAGRVTMPISDTFALHDAAAAYEQFRQGNKFGKIVLTNGE